MVERVQARVFGEVADEYDRIRPGYPSALVDEVLAYAELRGAAALEVGAGTGKATLAFAERGVTLTSVEPDQAMAAVLARRVAGHPDVAVQVCAFEEFVPRRPYGLLFSAQAWHWTDPEVRWTRAASALTPGGALALFWNADRPASVEVFEALRALHRAHGVDVEPGHDLMTPDMLATAWPRTDLAALADFTDLSERLYAGERTLSSVDFVAYLSTQSPYLLLDEYVRRRLLAAVVELLGERITLTVQTSLFLARRRPA
jgi:SAM-dependent methyltransferase